jgi:predicted ATP-dependent serine protease
MKGWADIMKVKECKNCKYQYKPFSANCYSCYEYDSWEAEKVEEVKTVDKTEYIKPPLGVMPRYIHEEQRIKDICRALNDYAQQRFDEVLLHTWATELCDRLEYLIENRKHP